MAKRVRWAIAVTVACSVVAACSDGAKEQILPTVCVHAPVPATGPGDVDRLFPVDVGRTWTYEETESTGPFVPPVLLGTRTVSVGPPATHGGEPVAVFTNTWTGAARASGTDLYAVRPAGVYLVSSTDARPPLDQLLPDPLLPFSPDVAPTTVVTCQHLRFVLEGETWDTDLSEWISAVGTMAELPVAAGTFTGVGVVNRQIDLTLRGRGTTIPAHIEVSDYFAPGVGLVLEATLVTARCYGCTVAVDSTYLVTTHAPPAAAAAAASPGPGGVAPPAAPPDRSVEEVARRIARRLVRPFR